MLLCVALVPLLFAAYTHQAWEDYYITLRSSQNLAEGHGLVYQVGEKVHTFTSPLGVLVPALGFKLTGGDLGALWFLRIVSALAVAATAALVLRHAHEHGWSRGAGLFAVVAGLLEAKIVACTVNGMEAGFLVFFTALAWTELLRPAGPRRLVLAAAYAGLMWTRPDACVLAAAMTIAAALFTAKTAPGGWRAWSGAVVSGILLGGLLYAPWFLWAWHYYGSPIPQTIIAKSIYAPKLSLTRILLAPWNCLVNRTALDVIYMPMYALGGWPDAVFLFGKVFARLAAFAWILPGVPRPARAASFALLLGGVYLQQIMPYPWYFPPWTLLGAIGLAGAGGALLARVGPRFTSSARIVAGVTAGLIVGLTVAQGWSARVQQDLIEEHGRKQIGLWLREHAAPGDTVFLEPIGYIGYFSRLKILDYPGLVAPEVSNIIRSGGRGGYARLIDDLRPNWLVLRPYELAQQNLMNSPTLAAYTPIELWSQRSKIDAHTFLPGRPWVEFDAEFVVFQRKPDAPVKGP